MNYTKPDVAVLGQAVVVIEGSTSKPGNFTDTRSSAVTPAYDLDE